MDHVGEIKHKPINLPAYQWEGTCSCGWATKMPNETAAKSQLAAHGATLKKAEKKEEVAPVDTGKVPEKIPMTPATPVATDDLLGTTPKP